MTTCTDVVSIALRKLSLTFSGNVPTSSELSDGISSLQSMYDGWVAQNVFGRLNPVRVSVDYSAKEQDQVVKTTALTVTLPVSVSEDGYERLPKDLSCVRIVSEVDTNVATHIFDVFTARWVRIDNLAPTDDAPLANRGKDGLASCLALYIASEYGISTPAAVALTAGRFMRSLTHRSMQSVESVAQVYF
jgi:hypothetical protein